MSRIGKQIVMIPAGVTVTQNDGLLRVKGPQGELTRPFRSEVAITIDGDKITFTPTRNDKFVRSLWGTYAAIVKNMVTGVVTPYAKKLIVEGVGYKWELKGNDIQFALGFSHPVIVPIPAGLSVKVEKQELTITGIDKEAVGLFANKIRSMKKPEPYKGKGIRYSTETIRRKQGKKSA